MRGLSFFGAGAAITLGLFTTACGGDDTGPGGGATTSSNGGFTPAMHAPLPQVINLGGAVLANPKVQPIVYASDPNAADVDAFLAELAATSYWGEVTGEYGVGPLTVLPRIDRPEAPPATTTDTALANALVDNTGVGAPWGTIDPEAIYLFVLPEGTIIDADGPCCLNFDGFHDEAYVNGMDVPYAVVCTCPGFDGPMIDDLQQLTVVMSHEIVEAATDPHVWTDPAFAQADEDDLIWTLVTGGETADMCTFDPDSYVIPDGSNFMVQRIWSNAAAKAGHDPCLPAVKGTPFFAGAPVLPDALAIKGIPFTTKGVKVPAGQKKTIDVALWSDGPTAEPWSVKAFDFNEFFGGPPNLALTLDKNSGQNGDVLKLTIEVLSIDGSIGSDAFFIVSQQGQAASLVMGAAGN